MNLLYFLGAIGLTTVFYWIARALVNLFREEGTPKKSFFNVLQRLFSDRAMSGLQRWILAERLISIVLLFCFSVIVFYRFWSTDGQLDLEAATWIPFPVLVLLSLFCTLPLMSWGLHAIGLLLFFTGNGLDLTEVHWLTWLRDRFKAEKKGCLYSILAFVQFIVLCLQFLFTFAFCYTVLKIAFIP